MDRLVLWFVMSVATILLLASPTLGSYKDVAVGTAGSLFASVIFAWVYQSRFEKFMIESSSRLLMQSVRDGTAEVLVSVRRDLQGLSEEISRRLRTHTPLRVWAASDSPHDQFNQIVNEHATKSTSYRYKGDRGLYLVYRLTQLRDANKLAANCRIEVLLVDPRDREAIQGCVRNRLHRSPGVTVEQANEQHRREIYATLAGLHALSGATSITVGFTRDIPFYRYELLDTAMFVSILPSLQDGRFAETMQYSPDSDLQRYLRRQFENEFSAISPEQLIKMSAVRTDAELAECLRRLECDVSMGELWALLDRYKRELR